LEWIKYTKKELLHQGDFGKISCVCWGLFQRGSGIFEVEVKRRKFDQKAGEEWKSCGRSLSKAKIAI